MPSITIWNRLEPRPRAEDITQSLAARVRDPLWLLARQWQVGEFRGEDAGSPAFVTLAVGTSTPDAWRVQGADEARPLVGAPIEALCTAESLNGVDASLAVELGQLGEEILGAARVSDATRAALRRAFPVREPSGNDDEETERLLGLCAGRALDGVALYHAARRRTAAALADRVVASAGNASAGDAVAVAAALAGFMSEVTSLYGALDGADSPAWQPARLAYEASVLAGSSAEARPASS
jgi:hypothetical protein